MAGAFVRWYSHHLEHRPVLTQSIMSCTGLHMSAGMDTVVVQGLGDIVAQQAVEGRGWEHQWDRTLRIALFGFAISGPVVSRWYKFMDTHIRMKNTLAQTVTRVAADQAFVAPTFMCTFLYYNDMLAGHGHDYAVRGIQEKFWPTLMKNYTVWPAVHMINFLVVPVQHRLLVTNTVGVFWNAYLAYVANRKVV